MCSSDLFMALGAYASVFITVKMQQPFILGLLFACLVAGVAGFLIGVPTLRLKGDYLAIATLGLGEIIRVVLQNIKAVLVNLGCGLDETGKACDNGLCRIVNVDFPDVIEVRKELIIEQDREQNIACDLKDYSWMDRIDGTNGVIFFAAGVFHYFKRDEVKTLVLELAKRYKGGCLVFDSVGKLGLKLMMSKTLKNMGISDVEGLFYINNPIRELNWSKKVKVNSKGYMLGYYDLKSPNIRFSHRFLAMIGDRMMKMAIHRMDFE